MSLATVKVSGVEFDVYYECEIEHDPLGTGDSPDEYNIEIISIEAGTDTQDLSEVISTNIWNDIVNELIKIEAE